MTALYLLAAVAAAWALVYYFAPKGWRTIATNAVAILPVAADVVVSLSADGTLIDVLPPEIMPVYTIVVILANFYLRTVTTTPLGRRD